MPPIIRKPIQSTSAVKSGNPTNDAVATTNKNKAHTTTSYSNARKRPANNSFDVDTILISSDSDDELPIKVI